MRLLLFVVLFGLFYSCGNEVQDDSKNTKKKVQSESQADSSEIAQPQIIEEEFKKVIVNKDSLIEACEKHIIDSYHRNIGDEDFGREFQVKGSLVFENDDFIILNFEEIIEYGSWNYTSSSIFFNKSRGKLEMVSVDSKKDENCEITINLNYQGRVNGTLEQKVMVNGNDLPDFIMKTSQTFRTNESNWENIYELNLINNKLELFDLSTHSMIIVGECEGAFGTVQKIKVMDTKSDLPVIEIQNSESECIEGLVQVNEMSNTQYQWDPNTNKFLLIR